MPRPSRAYVVAQLAGWTAYAALGVLMTRLFGQYTPALAATNVLSCVVVATMTHGFRAHLWRRRWFDLGLGPLVIRLAGSVVVMSLAAVGIAWVIGLYVTHAYELGARTLVYAVAGLFNWFFSLMLWTTLYAGTHFFRHWRLAEIRRLQLEVAARQAQLDSLAAQIHPHFFFNSLNTLRALIAEDPARARDLMTDLADLMRYALQAGRREKVPLGEELEVVEHYLRLEQARFDERLRWRIRADDAARRVLVPPMIVQTLVENAVKHGVALRAEGGDVDLSATDSGGELRVRITNPGDVVGVRDGGIGLANSRDRLRLLYADRARLDVSPDGAGRVVAELVLPGEGAA